LSLAYTLAALLVISGAPSQTLTQTVPPSEVGSHNSKPVTLHIAAAADLQPVMPALAAAYEKETGIKLEVSFGSSSALATQIINGAPMDIFLGADFSFPEKVVAANLADQPAPTPHATGTLVVWSRNDSGIKPVSIDRITDAKVTRIAVADQFHAPFGRAAYAAMESMKLLDKVKSKLVTAENVAQAAQFAESGNAQIAFISLTLASTPHMKEIGTFNRVPEAAYPAIRQCGVVIKSSPNLSEAHKFLVWLTSTKVQNTLTQFGLDPAQ
jgi:molybdate transport system substrate-binding protein